MGDSISPAEDDGKFELPAGHVANVGGVVHKLVHADQRERPGHKLDNRPQPAHGSAQAQTGKTSLADGCVDDALRTKTRQHPFGHLISAVVFGHFLAKEKDIRIAVHLLGHGLAESFSVLDFGHRSFPTWRRFAQRTLRPACHHYFCNGYFSARTSLYISLTSGCGLWSANCTASFTIVATSFSISSNVASSNTPFSRRRCS